ncbi:MAG TPA: NADH-quinone oxidoreductase subunit A [Armatimonadetes bacterium]|nr:NADH-quinone oxidoreductase subunit A [Armatimonadota bacterium]
MPVISDYTSVAIFLLVGVGFVTVTLWFSWLVRPHHPTREKLTPYECGEQPIGDAWVQFRVIYYIFALIFVIFDIETLFVIPWAVILRKLVREGWGLFAVGEMMVFLGILLIGWLYAWRKGAFEWK